ncbi:ATP-binding response regulator [Photobacterium lipolyticum]|nr:hybrid sensor histidine kinase/response regulator [Photobacterium lipolyticum]
MYLNQKAKEIYKYAEPNLLLVGLFGVLGFPAYYILWQYVFPQAYENLPLRIFCSVLFIPFIIKDYMPSRFKKYQHLYFLIAVSICLPYFFCFMMLKNDWSVVWMMSFLASIFLSILLVYDWLVILIASVFSFVCAFVSVFLLDGYAAHFHFEWPYIVVFVFAYMGGIVFNYRNQVEHEGRILFARTFSAAIAHEMRNPLGSVYSSIEVVNELLPKKGRHNANSEHVISEANLIKIGEIIKDSLAVIDGGNETINLLLSSINNQEISNKTFKRYSIRHVIELTLKSYGYKKPADKKLVRFDYEKDSDFLGSDVLLRYVIFNLLKNALYYKSKKGFSLSISLLVEENCNIIRVRDTGVGIAKKDQEHIFDEFYTSGKKGSSGLGLPFCKKVITAFGGEIACRSKLAEWTEFSIILPKYNSEKTARLKSDLLATKKMLYVGTKSDIYSTLQGHAFYRGYHFTSAKGDAFVDMDESELAVDVIVVDLECIAKNAESFELIENKLQMLKARIVYLYSRIMPNEVRFNRMIPFELLDKQANRYYLINKLDQLFFEPVEEYKTDVLSAVNNKQKIMIVDDNVSLRTYSGLLLEKQGYEVVHAENGCVALDYLENDRFDMILMDLEMPYMGGIETAKQIRSDERFKEQNQVPIICFTGNMSEEVIKDITDSGMNDYLLKPTSKEHLLSKVASWT